MTRKPVKDIPRKAQVTTIWLNGDQGYHGIMYYKDLRYMLYDFTYDPEFDMWFRAGCDYAYDVKEIKD
jgi:hypothetical protein